MINLIEDMHLGHFKYLPEKLGFDVHKTGLLHIINCGLNSSMFNIVFGGINHPTSQEIATIIEKFKGQPFAWWIPPSQKNDKLVHLLKDAGFIKEANEEAMICDLSSLFQNLANTNQEDLFTLKTNLNVKQVKNMSDLEGFIHILETYDSASKEFYLRLKKDFSELSEKLFIGRVNGSPAVIGILYSMDQTSSIFGLITKDNMHGKGYGSDMMKSLLNFAKQNGSIHVTLSASSAEGYRLYERLGFKKQGSFDCFEHKGIHVPRLN